MYRGACAWFKFSTKFAPSILCAAPLVVNNAFRRKDEDGPGLNQNNKEKKGEKERVQPQNWSSPRRNIDDALSSNNGWPPSNWDNNWDMRDPREVAKDKAEYLAATDQERQKMVDEQTPKATRNIILIRHGQYLTEAERNERKLTPLGREQAAFLGRRLAEAKQKFPIDACTFSTMIRAKETGQIMLKEMPHLKLECELDAMLEEGPPYPPDPPIRAHWNPKKSSFYEHGARIEAAFRKYFHRASPRQKEDSCELIVCHANVIRYFVCRALQYPPEGWLRISLAHTSITWIQITPNGRVLIKAMGDFGHLPADKMSFE